MRLVVRSSQNQNKMNNPKIKTSSKQELYDVLKRIYRSLGINPIVKKRLKPIPIESDWNWHYNY